MNRDHLKRTREQFSSYIDAVVAPDLVTGGEVAKRHTVSKTIVGEGLATRVTEAAAFISGELVIWCQYGEPSG